jgi:eukaryotic-like serine/threonine-protein kinase
MTLLYVPGGKFTMGDAGESYKVSLAAFWIDQTEVTNAMYANCVKANQCNPPRQNNSNMRTSYYGNSEFDNYPVIYVSWQDASDYCKSVGRRLPTEAEWEKAARGTDGRLYPWDTKPSPNKNLLNYNKEVGDTTAVGNYPAGASPFGVLDMAGNVMEWVSSLYRPYPYDPNDGREDMNTTDSRVQRGGSWNRQGDEYVSSAHRGYAAQTDNRSNEVGFRCALS